MRRSSVGLIFLTGMLTMMLSAPVWAGSAPLNILVTTFPIFQITRNITQGADGIDLALMIPANLGCPHDYALTPADMQKLARADILIINGLGMEEFLGQPLKQANPKLHIVDSSTGIQDTLNYSDEPHHDAEKAHSHQASSGSGHADASHGHDHGKKTSHHDHARAAKDHDHSGVNPHLFASPRMAAKMTLSIAAELARLDPARAASYQSNAQAYAQRLNALADDFSALRKKLKNTHMVTQHGVFDYLARDMGLEIVAVLQAHAGQDPSAADMLDIVKTIKKEGAGAIFTEPQYPVTIGETIARETGIPTAVLDPVATGSETAPLDYYEITMRRNMDILVNTLGVNP